jgi:SpoVK/Ycf46/Vps4 family AAA+-type ATPase
VTVGGYTKAVQNAIPAAKQKKISPIDIIRQTLDAHANLLNIVCDNTRDKMTRAPAYSLSGLNIDQNIDDILEIATNFNGIWNNLDGSSAAQSLNILLYGAPGTGKTEFVRYLARSLNRNLVIKRASDLLGKYVGETEANIKAAFCEAEESKAILFFDEADSFLNNRNNAERNFEVQQVNELLTQMENFNGIFIAATNFNGRLDNASRRRFAIKVKFDYLTREGIETVWASFFPKLCCPERIKRMTTLAPGDFGAVYNQLRYMPEYRLTADYVANVLEREIEAKEGIENKRRMGF